MIQSPYPEMASMELDSIISSSNISTEVIRHNEKKYSLPKKIGYGKVAKMVKLIILGINVEIL